MKGQQDMVSNLLLPDVYRRQGQALQGGIQCGHQFGNFGVRCVMHKA
ncbi:MAG: Uncharacterised protein [SAR116 cluster bacterium]|nr:MAG: Uncharacterised protein [SAR116 cluster bacterium]